MRWGVLSFYLRVFYHERKYTKGRFQYRNLHFYFSFLYNYLRHGHLIILIQFINIQYTIFDFILISDYLVTFLRSVLNSILLYEFTNSILSLLLCFFFKDDFQIYQIFGRKRQNEWDRKNVFPFYHSTSKIWNIWKSSLKKKQRSNDRMLFRKCVIIHEIHTVILSLKPI